MREDALDNLNTEYDRLTHVIREFWCYTRAFQGDLTERAIHWSVCSLVAHERRSECKADFFALVDLMFLSTDEGQKALTDNEREQIECDADAVQNRLTDVVLGIVNASWKQLRALNENDLRRVIAEPLMRVSREYLCVAEILELRDLIAHCFAMCEAVNGYKSLLDLGYADLSEQESNCQKEMVAVSDCCSQIFQTAVKAGENGRLFFRDGKFFTPPENMDLADLYDVSLPMTSGFFESEVKRLGVPISAVKESAVQAQITENWFVILRTRRVKAICHQLHMTISEEQARNIAKNSLVSHEWFSTGVPLSLAERMIAIEIHYQAQKVSLEKDGVELSDDEQRNEARRAIAFGEKGITILHKIGKTFFGG